MKKYICGVLGVMLLAVAAGAVHLAQEEDAPKELSFNGQTYYLQYSTENAEMKLREYLPKGQNFDNYTHMLALRAYKVNVAPKDVTAAMIKNYGQSSPNSKMGLRPLNNGYRIDFIMTGGGMVEFNIFKIIAGTPGPLSLQYVYREKAAGAENFVKTVTSQRAQWVDKLEKMAVPSF